MSLDGLRDAYSREKKNEIANCELSRKRKLRELYNYTALLNAGHPPQLHSWVFPEEPSEHELLFLDQNDISKHRRFDDSTLPFPTNIPSLPSTLPSQAPAKSSLPSFAKPTHSPATAASLSLEEQLRAAPASPSVAIQPLPSAETIAQKDAVTPKVQASPHVDSKPQPKPEVTPSMVDDEAAIQASIESQQPKEAQPVQSATGQDAVREGERVPDGPSVDPNEAIPPNADDVAILPDAVIQQKEKPKAPQVVHLPPQDVQEARLHETERKLERAREKDRKEEEKLPVPTLNGQTDIISSPSSTVGPYSQATPHAPHHSPDTSPDTDSFRDRVAPAAENGVGPDPATQKAKEEHDRALQLQMQEARARARDDRSETPDVERQIEDEQAIRLARDGKSRLSESQPAPGHHNLTEHAEDVAREVTLETSGAMEDKRSQAPAADSLPTPTTIAPEPSSLDSESAESHAANPQESTTLGPEHPTPPADVDVEMDDGPIGTKEPATSSHDAEQPPLERTAAQVTFEEAPPKPVSAVNEERKTPHKPMVTPRSSDLSALVSPGRSQLTGREVSTIVFAKQENNRQSKTLHPYNDDYASLQGASQDSNRDYLEGLFQYQAHHPPRSQPLSELVSSARKTVSTAGTLAMLRESQDYKILKRVYQLQNANRWSLRQLQKSAEPSRPVSHIDHMLKEMKWMQTDFKEERKWKRALAATFAGWCAEYVNSSVEERASLRIRARVPNHAPDEDMNDAPTPDLIPSGANETETESFADDEEMLSSYGSVAPASLFTFGYDDVVMKIDRTPASDTMFHELPFYEPNLEGGNDITPLSFCDPPILPVSKFVTGKLVSKVRGPPRKRSRYEYESEDEPSSPPSRAGTSAEHSMPSTPGRRLFHRNDLPPEMTDVALFNTENKHVRDRLQAAHQFRPPTEFPMPSVSFFENRTSSQWLWEEDQKLRGLVKEFTFNWSLVAQQLSLPSIFVSGSGRRTPWECFERWVQLEGLPAEMSKTQYFRTYQTRLEQAQRTVTAQHQAQQQMMQQQAQSGQSVSGQPRRRTTQPIRVERRRENRHLAIIDGMRKLARKRESIAHKQAESQKAAALRKAHEPAKTNNNVHTPQEFSRLKWEREEKMKQRMQSQQELNMRQAMAAAAQRQQGMQGQQGMPNGVNPQQRNGTPNNANVPTPLATSNSQQGHPVPNANMAARQHQPQQPMQGNFPNNANMNGMSMGNAAGVPQAQMQNQMQNAQRGMGPPNQVQMAAMQRGQFPSTNQHQFQLQQQQINMASNLTASMNMGSNMPNANMMANMASQNMNGNMNASMNGMGNNAGSPRLNQVSPQMQGPARPLSSGHMPQLLQIQNNLKTQHPDWTPEQVQKMASDQLSRFLAKQRAQAMNAASGMNNQSPQIGNNVYLQGGMPPNSPSPNAVQNYQNQLLQQQRMMSQQQQRQQQQGSPGLNPARPVSRSATPQNPQQMGMQSPNGQQAQMNRS